MNTAKMTLAVALMSAVMLPAATFAADKTYQVTGKVVSVDDKTIIVDKEGEKFEMARTADTKVMGDLKVGEKVTAHYSITAVKVEVKSEKAKAEEKAPKAKTDKK